MRNLVEEYFDAEFAARKILKNIKNIYSRKHKIRIIDSLDGFDEEVIRNINDVKQSFESVHCQFICDYVDYTLQVFYPDGRPCPSIPITCYANNESKTLFIAYYFVPNRILIYDLISLLSTGEKVTTTNAKDAAKLSTYPLYNCHTYPYETTLNELMNLHEQTIISLLATKPGTIRFIPTNTEEVLNDLHAEHEAKHQYRKQLGWLTDEELMSIISSNFSSDHIKMVVSSFRNLVNKEQQYEIECKNKAANKIIPPLDKNHENLKLLLKDFSAYISTAQLPLRDYLYNGLSKEIICQSTTDLPFELPDEIISLYQWANGTNSHNFFPAYEFLSLELALESYIEQAEFEQEMLEEYADNENSADEDQDVSWSENFFPLFYFNGEYYFVDCNPALAVRPIYHYFAEVGYTLAFKSLFDMLNEIFNCFKQGAYYFEEDYIEEDEIKTEKIKKALMAEEDRLHAEHEFQTKFDEYEKILTQSYQDYEQYIYINSTQEELDQLYFYAEISHNQDDFRKLILEINQEKLKGTQEITDKVDNTLRKKFDRTKKKFKKPNRREQAIHYHWNTGRIHAVSALSELNDERVIPLLTKLLDDPIEDIKAHAANALSKYQVKSILPKIIEFTKKFKEDFAKITALSAVADMVSPEDEALIPEIMPHTKHKQDIVRCQAVRAISNIGSDESSSFLTKMLEDEKTKMLENEKQDRTLLAIVDGLGKLGKYESIDPLEKVRNSVTGYHRDAIDRAIALIKKKNS